MTGLDQTRQQMATDMGLKRLHRGFAKLEIFLGLLALAGGQVFILFAFHHIALWGQSLPMLCGGVLLFVLGGYLALAGHRSHIYQSTADQTAYIIQQIQTQKKEG